jgi:hypothetical protein
MTKTRTIVTNTNTNTNTNDDVNAVDIGNCIPTLIVADNKDKNNYHQYCNYDDVHL